MSSIKGHMLVLQALRRKDTCYFCKKDGHTSVVEIDSRDPTRVRTDTCPGNFWKVLEICITSFDVYDFK